MERKVKVPESSDGDRIDKALKELVPDLSRRKLRGLIEKGAVYIDNKRCLKLSRVVSKGSILKIEGDAETVKTEQPPPLEILYEAGGLVAVNKPPFLPSQPTPESISSAQLIVSKMKAIPLKEVRPMSRLDLPVSGVLVFALDGAAANLHEEAKREGRVEKTYLAWVHGTSRGSEGIIDLPLSSERGSARVDGSGKGSMTLYKVLRTADGYSLLEVSPRTGRMHQIRVHLKEAGMPIVGDRKYGVAPFPAGRPLLHCLRVVFPSREEGKMVTVEAPPPADFEEFQKKIEDKRARQGG